MKFLCDNESKIIKATVQKNRMFTYNFNENKTKKKLLKGVEVKTGNTNLRLSGGSYHEVILPLLKSWSLEVGNTLLLNQTEIEIIDHEVGIEGTDKHVDTKVVVLVNSNRLVLHAYNSTQNLMVQGKTHEKFAVNCLVPFIGQKI